MALSQRNLVAGSYTLHCNDPEFMLAAAGLQQETTLAVLPMFHIYGLNVTMTSALHLGAKQVITYILTRLKHSFIYNLITSSSPRLCCRGSIPRCSCPPWPRTGPPSCTWCRPSSASSPTAPSSPPSTSPASARWSLE